ncbi:MAG: PAS domain S-box protein [Balneolaceae bacterium]|nr:PAS domain S-box protein [Balneolaceae bacterium]
MRLYGTIQDIDERKRTEEQLRKTEQKLRDVVENSTNLFYKHTPDHTLTYISPQSEHFFACSAEEAMIDWTEFLTDHPENKDGIQNTEKAIETGERQPPFEIQIKRMDGKKLWVEVNEAPITENGETVAIVGSLTDITDRKNVEEKLRKSLREKETLLAEIHHRVKNNLAVVASMLQIQAIGTANKELNAELLESVLRIKSMASIHENLYKTSDFSEINFAENVRTIIHSVINTMQYETEISVNFDYDEVYLKMIQAVPASLIINEVATNIIKHGFTGMESGTIDVKIEQKNGHMKVRVIDNGVGLPDDFNPENPTTLGLQLIRTLTDQLNGEYNYPEQKKGCEFCLEFDTKIDIVAED